MFNVCFSEISQDRDAKETSSARERGKRNKINLTLSLDLVQALICISAAKKHIHKQLNY